MARKTLSKICSIFFCALTVIASLHTPALAVADEDLQTLEMFYEGKDLVVSATRNPKPLSQTAENVTVITAAEIEAMGAHNLPEVLNNVSGFVTEDRGSVGTFSSFSIYGSDPAHVLVLLDGVTLNFFSDGSTDIARVPVQHIERVEIIKGPASSSWGSALGGVVNIVTKSPIEEKKLGGALSFSAGARGTRDSRGETSGTVGKLGYYLFASNLTSGGLQPHTNIDENNLYAKLRWELPAQASLNYTLAYTKGASGGGQVDIFQLFANESHHYFLSTLSLNAPVSSKVGLDISLRTSSRVGSNGLNDLISGLPIQDADFDEKTYGGSAKATWRESKNSLVLGGDFDYVRHNDSSSVTTIDAGTGAILVSVTNQDNLRTDKWGLFLNDTLTIGNLAITPGIRYDRMRQVGDFISPSLGIAWSLNDQTVLRANAARGYSLPVILPGSTQEKVVAFQAGAETTQVPYLWLKTTLFLNYISDHQAFALDANGNVLTVFKKQKKQGIEIEAKTVPFFNTSLSAGCTFVDARDRGTDEILQNVPRQIVKLGLHYDDKRSFRASLLGRFVWFNAEPDNNPKDGAVIWDLNLAKNVLNFHDTALELFFTGHNIFNGAQYSWEGFKNARRWLEGGIRFNF